MCRRDPESNSSSSSPKGTTSSTDTFELRNRGATSTTQKQQHQQSMLEKAVDGLQKVKFRRRGIISGLDAVVFGTVSAAEAIHICGIKPPQYLWYMISGSLCDIIQLGIDCILHFGFHITDPSLCWSIGLFLSVFFRHTSHRYFVFGMYVGGYTNSLMRMYAGYSVILVLSTVFNFFMTHYVKVPHYVAWIITLLWTGIVNYFILKKLWSFGGSGSKTNTSPAVSVTADSATTMLLPLQQGQASPTTRDATTTVFNS